MTDRTHRSWGELTPHERAQRREARTQRQSHSPGTPWNGTRELRLCADPTHRHCQTCGCPLAADAGRRRSCVSCIERGEGVAIEGIAAQPMLSGPGPVY